MLESIGYELIFTAADIVLEYYPNIDGLLLENMIDSWLLALNLL